MHHLQAEWVLQYFLQQEDCLLVEHGLVLQTKGIDHKDKLLVLINATELHQINVAVETEFSLKIYPEPVAGGEDAPAELQTAFTVHHH